MPDWAFHYAGYAVAIIAVLGVLLALFRDRAKGRARCRKCWYDLAGAGDLPILCPECGKSHTKPRHLKKTRRHKRLALMWLLVMAVGGYGLWVVPRVKSEAAHGLVPSTVLRWIIVHVPMNKYPKNARWGAIYQEIAEHWETEEGRRNVASDMRWWLRLGLVDASGFYGNADLQTNDDMRANIMSWSLAGMAFQRIVPLEELPPSARNERIEREIIDIVLSGQIVISSGEPTAQITDASLPWGVVESGVVVKLTPHPSSGSQSSGQILAGNYTVWMSDVLSTPMESNASRVKMVIPKSAAGVYRTVAVVEFDGEFIGSYLIDFVQDQTLGGASPRGDYFRGIKVVRIKH